MDEEFNAIQTAVATKADTNSPTLTGTPFAPTATAGTNTTQIATTAFVSTAGAARLPAGSVTMYAAAAAPTGWLICNGAAVSRTLYADLFTAIGTTFGTGDGSTTFNLPNFTDRMPMASGGLYSLGSTGGSKDAVAVAHTHTATSSVTDPGHVHSIQHDANSSSTGAIIAGSSEPVETSYNTDSATTGITVSTTVNSAGVSGTDANLPPYLGINFIIRT